MRSTEFLAYMTKKSNRNSCVEPGANKGCQQSPGSEGCMTVRSKYQDKIIDHTNVVEDDHEKYSNVIFN